MKNFLRCVAALACLGLSVSRLPAEESGLNYSQLARNVVKVVSYSANGRVSMGSGVIIDQGRVATNCHITRAGQKIAVYQGMTRFPAKTQVIAPELDLCVIHTDHLKLDGVYVGTVDEVKVGDEIVIAGYPHAGGLSLVKGRVTGLHPHENSHVIETDAGFIQGSSGGALFNASGQLVGLTTFLTYEENNRRYFAIPIDWLKIVNHHTRTSISPYSIKTFWERGVKFKDASIPYRRPG